MVSLGVLASAPPPSPDVVEALGVFQGYWNGLYFGDGTDYVLEASLDGLLAYESRLADQPVPAGDGDIAFSRYAAGRFVVLSFAIVGEPLSASLEDKVVAFNAAFNASDPYAQDWLLFRTVSRTLLLRARVARRRIDLSPSSSKSGVFRATVELKVADPRLYDGAGGGRNSVIVPYGPAVGGGFDLVAEIPLDLTASSGGDVIAVNGGNAPAAVILRVSNAGPGNVTAFEVSNVTSGVVVSFVSTILPGQTLVADFEAMARHETGPYVHIDGVSRFGDWQHPRLPLYLLPGENVLAADVTGGVATVRVDWLDTTL